MFLLSEGKCKSAVSAFKSASSTDGSFFVTDDIVSEDGFVLMNDAYYLKVISGDKVCSNLNVAEINECVDIRETNYREYQSTGVAISKQFNVNECILTDLAGNILWDGKWVVDFEKSKISIGEDYYVTPHFVIRKHKGYYRTFKVK